jgi:hypothetical protein
MRDALYTVLLVWFCATLSGCMAHREIRVKHQPLSTSPLAAIHPTKLCLALTNACAPGEADILGSAYKTVFVIRGGSVAALEAAFRSELESAGHRVVASGSDEAEGTVAVAMKRMRIDVRTHQFGIIKLVTIEGQISVWRSGQESRASHFVANETQEIIGGSGLVGRMFNEAFNNFIHKTVLDARFVAPFKH